MRFRVSRIAVRDVTKDRGPRAAGIPITDRALELVSDPEVDVVVEVAGGTAVEPILVAALAAGKPVVTANKALLASKLAELGVLAQRTETPLYCEAAAAAAHSDHPSPQSSRRRDRQPVGHRQRAPATS